MVKKIMARPRPDIQPNLPVSPTLARIYGSRGVLDDSQLNYSLAQLYRPSELRGIDDALTLLVACYQVQSRILIVGDFDADGATSTAVAVRCLRALGFRSVDFLVPNRFEYGYGLTPEIVAVAKQFQPELLITVDNGISSHAGVAEAKAAGINVLVTDHHLPAATLPSADAIVNPNQPGCEFPTKNCAGVGVIFYVMLALRARMQQLGLFTGAPPNLAEYLDLVALGTVADVVPLDHNNRIFVQQGLLRMRAGQACEGIKAIAQVAGRQLTKLRATDLGFIVGPRLNAAGRLDDMSLGIRCLLSDNAAEALALAAELDALNKERRAIETSMQADAASLLAQFDNRQDALPAGVCLYQEDWHQGVIGILASRVKDKLHRPTIVFADDGDDLLKGSGRSVAGIHLRDVLDEVATANLGMLTKFGGHAMAAGLSLEKRHLPQFQQSFAEVVARRAGEEGLTPVILTDGELLASEFSLALARELESAGPWGQAFPEPTFHGQFTLLNQRIVGQKHLKLVLGIVGAPSFSVDAIYFNVDLAEWPNPDAREVLAAFKLQINEFNGRENIQLLVDYLTPL